MSSALPLSRRLRRETKIAHRLVEGTRLARAFFRGSLTTSTYAEGLARLYPVYATMEAALADSSSDDRLRNFYLPAVFRTDALRADLSYFGVATEPMRAGASTAYVERIHQLTQENTMLLVAHAYVRFMADVSGGLIAGKIAQRALKLPSRQGLAFLSFPAIPDAGDFRTDFRRRLDAFPKNESESQALVAEANLAFELNRRLADELWEELLSR